MRRHRLQPPSEPQPDKIPRVVFENVDALLHEQSRLERELGLQHRLADALVSAFGTLPFLLLVAFGVAGWILINLGRVPGVQPFDPFPFGLLSDFVSVSALLLAVVILMSQNRASEIETRRDELNLHVSLLIERETTTLLKKIARLETMLEINVDENEASQTDELTKDTTPAELASQIELSTQNFNDTGKKNQ